MKLLMHKLALDLGKTIRELECVLTMSELNEWVAYFEYMKGVAND